MRVWRKCVLFYLGGTTYMILEFLWRGRSHSSMFVLGGLCFLMVGALNRWLNIPLAFQLILSAILITGLELITGLLVNRDYDVWDYRGMPYHYLGQVCLNYSLLWIPVSMAAILLYRWVEPKLKL